MRLIAIVFVTLTWLVPKPAVYADDTTQPPMRAVQDLFAGVSARDADAMRATSVGDFELLEVGKVWDMDKFVRVILEAPTGWTRRNYFSVITSREVGDIAWVSYWNRAEFSGPGGQSRVRRWLESAVLVKQNGGWRIEMLHSIRLNNNQSIPDDVRFEEYVPG